MNKQYIELVTKKGILRGFYTTCNQKTDVLVVTLHGFTGHKNETGYLFKSFEEPFTSNNINMLRFDFYGNGDSDGNFEDFDFDDVLNDSCSIIDFAYELNNHKKIILIGFSMGGCAAGRMSSIRKDKIQKIIMISPAGNMPQLIETKFKLNPLTSDGGIDLGGFKMSNKFLKSIENFDPYLDIDLFDEEVLIFSGSKDLSVPSIYPTMYSEKYKKATFHLVTGATHGYNSLEQREFLINTIIDFINKEK